MKEKLRKHGFSVVFSIAWSILGGIILWIIAIRYFPFLEGELIWSSARPLLGVSLAGYLVTALILARIRVRPLARSPFIVNFVASLAAAVSFMILSAFRVYFSLGFLAVYFVFVNAWFSAEYALRSRVGSYTFARVPGGYDLSSLDLGNCRTVPIGSPGELPQGVDGIVADFGVPLSKEWLSFISRCVLEGVPVVSADELVETQLGLIVLDNMTTARSVTFQHGGFYLAVKQGIDVLLILIALPVWLPLTLIACAAIALESRGSPIFTQLRAGRRGAPFKIYKIRSMRADSENRGPAFASRNDARVTRLGAVFRRFRIDELPQFLNVLRGEMALVGPRPEQLSFVERFELSIPYYQLRHIVRPGITGWAQVNQGYAAGEEETAAKLANDLYYVKHVSFILDFLVFIKTIRTVLTGFGSR
jgi:UDP-GalNAc:undecaprenyl-phosphate GalNAc-1-phosphate transferase